MESLAFDVHPNVVLKLGEELVADEFTAILETAKNAYDANARRIIIKVESDASSDDASSFFPNAKGTIRIDDNGDGMDVSDVKLGWLLVAFSRKRARKRSSDGGAGRVPLGDKGIGRLGLQRLGDCVEIYTRHKSDPSRVFHVGFRWSDFKTAAKLADVPVQSETLTDHPLCGKKGTEIRVSDLTKPDVWRGAPGRLHLASKLSELVSPFSELLSLNVHLSVGGQVVDLANVSKRALETAEQAYSFEFDGRVLKITAEFREDYFYNAMAKEPVLREKLASERYKTLIDRVLGLGRRSDDAAARSQAFVSDGAVVFRLTKEIALADLGEVHRVLSTHHSDGTRREKPKQVPASPGPFYGKIYHVARLAGDAELPEGFGSRKDLDTLVRAHAGVRVFRNGFAVRPYGMRRNDWLGLAAAWTSGSSFYGLRPENTLGFVAITADDNDALAEKTDREGFIETPAALNFQLLMQEVVHEANNANGRIRRQLVKLAKELAPKEPTPTNARSQSKTDRRSADGLSPKGGSSRGSSPPTVDGGVDGGKPNPEPKETAAQALRDSADLLDALSSEIERLQGHIEELLPLASVGLTAEAVAHELSNVTDALADRTRQLRKSWRRKGATVPVHPAARRFVEHVRSTVATMRKQLAHLNPSFKFVRESRDDVNLDDFIWDLCHYHRERLVGSGIDVIAVVESSSVVRANRGRLTQVLDNLILNAEYWVKTALQSGHKGRGEIRIVVDGPMISVADNGPGVAPHLEYTMFEAFETAKPKGKGRGLGLYISQKLLETVGGKLSVSDERNADGRLHRFVVDLADLERKGEDS
jgi:signal transduction histidine kinase